MKTKTIYHLDQDCNIVKIEVITKNKKKWKKHSKKECLTKSRLHEVFTSIENEHLVPVQKVPLQSPIEKKESRADYINRCFSLIMFHSTPVESWITRHLSKEKKQAPSSQVD